MRDRLSWYMVFLILPTILLARSLDKDRRVPYNIPSDWKALWFSNLDELQRVNEANDNNTVSNVTVQLGGTAFLHCKVRNLAERTVSDAEISWIRRRDFHVLTSSMFTYTNDERFQVLHPEGSDDWTLQIKYVQERDNGTYECQVSRSAGILSHFVNLNIVIPEAFILGTDEHHVDVGSVINLVCIIEKALDAREMEKWRKTGDGRIERERDEVEGRRETRPFFKPLNNRPRGVPMPSHPSSCLLLPLLLLLLHQVATLQRRTQRRPLFRACPPFACPRDS